jgi:hypothetical protein
MERKEKEAKVKRLELQWEGGTVSRSSHWGGEGEKGADFFEAGPKLGSKRTALLARWVPHGHFPDLIQRVHNFVVVHIVQKTGKKGTQDCPLVTWPWSRV